MCTFEKSKKFSLAKPNRPKHKPKRPLMQTDEFLEIWSNKNMEFYSLMIDLKLVNNIFYRHQGYDNP